ncbi:MAG: histidinol-phosphatase HisJ family protein [Bacillota bacterium]
MFDYHMHTSFSIDSKMEMEEAVKRAIDVGLQEIAFTDHGELNVWRPDDLIVDDIFHVGDYLKTLSELKGKYKKRIRIKIGIELGLQVEEKQRIQKLVQEYPFDFVIGSSHTIDRYDLYYRKFFEGKTKQEAYERYFHEILKIVKEVEDFSVYGHLDLVKRYALGVYENIDIEGREVEIIREILLALIEKGKGIEINTSGFRYGLGDSNPGIEIIKLYKALGGEIITVGSDAHRLEDIGYRIPETYELLRDIGFRYVTTFNQLKPEYVKL